MNFGKMKFALKNAVIASIVLNNWEKQLGLNSENGIWKNKLEFDENLKVLKSTQQEPLMSTGASQCLHLPKYFSIQNCLGPISGVKPFAGVIVSIPPFSVAWIYLES